MAIRYFATNRAFTDLGRAVKKRQRRLELQRGGYYFVDMERYLAHYLGEVDDAAMPDGAVVGNEFDETGLSQDLIFGDKFLGNDKVGHIVVCVHGFNVMLFEAFTWFRILTDSMRHIDCMADKIATAPRDITDTAGSRSLTAFVGFSWPSNGNVLSYLSDQSEA